MGIAGVEPLHRVSLWSKFTLARTLCTWSPNKVAHCLVSSRLFSGIIVGDKRKAFTTASFRKQRLFSNAALFPASCNFLSLGGCTTVSFLVLLDLQRINLFLVFIFLVLFFFLYTQNPKK
jgi:hypothetical protein